MPGLIPLIKKIRPELPIIYRSHIEIRSDLVHIEGSPQQEVWQYLWNNIQHADLFISHPVNKFVPSDVPIEKQRHLGVEQYEGRTSVFQWNVQQPRHLIRQDLRS